MGGMIKLPQLAWYGCREMELKVPDNWQVDICNMEGYAVPAMKPEQIKAALKNPIASPPISELAKGKKEAVIISDDMSRITRVAQIVPFVLEELAEAGIPESKIRFMAALGCHGALGRSDLAKKLGEDIVARFPVYNHNSSVNGCTYAGTTSRGIKVFANSEVMKCDLKIGIGSIMPHIMAGFGGGSKIIMPGITSLETNEAMHRLSARIRQENPEKPMGMGVYPGNPVREEIDEAASIVGLNFKIDGLFNMWGETTHVFAGDPRAEFAAGVETARKHYLSPRATDKDIVIANTYIKVNEPHSGITTTLPSIRSQGGDLVLVCNAPDGIVIHFLMGAFGLDTGGALSRKFPLPQKLNRMIVLNEYPEPSFAATFEPAEKVVLVREWGRVLELLNENHKDKSSVQVAVYPSSEVQYCAGQGGFNSLT